MMKKILLPLVTLVLGACQENDAPVPTIKVGSGDSSLTQLVLHPQSQHDILLSGGNGKYTVNVANSRLATASISQDTLKIKSFEEQGNTFAVIHSHDQTARLELVVRPNELSFSADEVSLAPTDINKTIRLGGGEVVSLTTTDPEGILSVTWEGSTGIVVITATAEGDALITAAAEGLTPKTLKVKVHCIDEKNFLTKKGVYNNRARFITQAINPDKTEENPTTGTLFLGRRSLPMNHQNNWYYKIAPIVNPVVGNYINVAVENKRLGGNVTYETLKFYVEEVRTATREVVLRGKTLKIVVTYYQ